MLTASAPAPLSISSVSRCPETGLFRFDFEVDGVEVSADLTVTWYVEHGVPYLRYALVDRVYTRDRALEQLVAEWVAANQYVAFDAVLEAV